MFICIITTVSSNDNYVSTIINSMFVIMNIINIMDIINSSRL